MRVTDFATTVGIVAAILAIWSGLVGAARWYWRLRARSSLRQALMELYCLDRELCEVAVEADYRLAEGVGWTGWEIWPDELAPLLERLWRLTFELDGMRARVRAQWAEGPIERLRDDIEQLVSLLRIATDHYTQGAIQRYRSSDGKPLGRSATGRGPTVVLPDEGAREEVGELRQTARLLFRSSAYQLDLRDAAEREDVALWPLEEREAWALALQGKRFEGSR